jgi:hypothetical protein
MSNKILFGIEPDNPQYKVSGIRDLSISINNKFFNQSTVDSDSNVLLHESSYVTVECLAATSEDIAILQAAAVSAMPIYCQISSAKVQSLWGCFVISHLSLDNSEDDIPQCAFKLKSSGNYEIR